MKIDADARYLESHEWARKEDDVIVIGITDFAQDELGDIVYVELPDVGDDLDKGSYFGTIESVKAASDVYSPMSGEVVEVNEDLEDEPELINEDAFGAGWMIKIEPTSPEEWDELLDADAYKKVIEEG